MTYQTARTLIAALALTTAFATVGATPSAADDPWSEPGAYVSLAAMNALQDFQDAEREFDNSWGFVLRGGYRFNRFLAFEGDLAFLSGFEVDIDLPAQPPTVPNPSTLSLTVDGGTGTGNVKFYAPWFGRIQPYGLAGIGGQWARLRTTYPTGYVCDPFFWYCSGTYTKLGNEGAFTSKFGGGIEFWLGDDFALMVDAAYNMPTGDLKDLRYTSIVWGAVFGF